MKIGIIGDIHWSQYSSIVRKRGERYSVRLENCIQSINWAEDLTGQLGCEFNIYMGDFFDKADLNSEEISALKEIKWNDKDKYFLVGNHEMGSNDLSISSTSLFELFDNYLFRNDYSKPFFVVDEPKVLGIGLPGELNILLLPYVLEENRKPIEEYAQGVTAHRRLLFMHNDIKDVQMGSFISKQGFSKEEIGNMFDLCINGHLHNGGKVSDKIINVGNLTGQNFSEDAGRYEHVIFILDTDTLKIDVYENPYALNFYKEDWTEGIPFENNFKNNTVLTIQTSEDTYEEARDFISKSPNIIESRVLLKPTLECVETESLEDLSIDHYKAFKEYVFAHIDAGEIAKEEVGIILS